MNIKLLIKKKIINIQKLTKNKLKHRDKPLFIIFKPFFKLKTNTTNILHLRHFEQQHQPSDPSPPTPTTRHSPAKKTTNPPTIRLSEKKSKLPPTPLSAIWKSGKVCETLCTGLRWRRVLRASFKCVLRIGSWTGKATKK